MSNTVTKYNIQRIGTFQDDGIYRLDFSNVSELEITSITIFDDSIISGGDGAASGFDLDYIALSRTSVTSGAAVNDLTTSGDTLNVFDFQNAVEFTPGYRREATYEGYAQDNLFGTSAGDQYNPAEATLGVLEAQNADTRANRVDGGLSLGEGGSITLTLTSAVSTNGLYLYLADPGGGNDTAYVSFNIDANTLGVNLQGTSSDDQILLGEGVNAGSGSGNDTVDGGSGNDTISTAGGNDSILGGRDNDRLIGGADNDIVNGGDGTDTAVYSSVLGNYVITTNAAGDIIVTDSRSSGDGSDTVSQVELFEFTDRTINTEQAFELIEPVYEIYRFFNPNTGAHFFTASTAERDHLQNSDLGLVYEGNSFDSNLSAANGGAAVYRFLNTENGVHFYTADANEANEIRNTLPQFNDEGIVYYAHTSADAGGTALYRFFNTENGSHFFTPSEEERDNIINTLGHYNYEGTAFYVDLA